MDDPVTDLSSSLTLSSSSGSGLSRPTSVMLYNGVSNRSRGWKSKRPGDLGAGVEGRLFRPPSLKKFDGAARTCSAWDHLRKDPELWFRNGNCFVHLYEKGQSQRGAAFKVPFTSLLAAQCQPLVERFVDRSVSEEEAHQNGRVDLYIPAPSTASRSQALQYHIATRNFFAWIFRRSVVGDQLGTALIWLVNTMEEFRELDADNVQDLLAYLDEEGYLDMRNQPNHALAVVRLAEVLQLRDLYMDAFAHCVGMSDRLYKHPEYSRVSVTSRKLIRRARLDTDFRLSRAGAMLGDLLAEEFSEAHLGLSTGARAHLDRFRAYIQGFYVTRFGSFPPPPADPRCPTIFRPEVYRTMQADFEALYEYLADETFTPGTADTTPPMAQGGLCSLQSVHEFDLRHRYTPLEHPLPLLPEPVKAKETRRRRSLPCFIRNGSLGSREDRLCPEQRVSAHAALMRSTNLAKRHLLENRLVRAYRQFEEDSILIQHKVRKVTLGVSPGDARKVRWLFIYAMYQILRGCAEVPREVKSTTDVDYHLGVSTAEPPWQTHDGVRPSATFDVRDGGKGPLLPRFQERGERGRSISAVPLLSPIATPQKDTQALNGMEIKPDIDYLALTHQDQDATTPRPGNQQSPARSMSFRRSLGVFRASTRGSGTSPAAAESPRRRTSTRSRASRLIRASSNVSYHEIIVYGYGNGTNSVVDRAPTNTAAVTQDPEGKDEYETRPQSLGVPKLSVVTTLTASRSASTSSFGSSASSTSTSNLSIAMQSTASASTTPTTAVDPQSPTATSSRQTSISWKSTANTLVADVHRPTTPCSLDDYNPTPVDYGNPTFPRIRKPSLRKVVRYIYSNDDMLSAADASEPPPLPRRSSKRSARRSTPESSPKKQRWSLVDVVAELRKVQEDSSDDDAGLQPSPLRIRKATQMDTHNTPVRGAGERLVGEEEEEEDVLRSSSDWERTVQSTVDVSPPCTWEQFTDLGGLQPIHLLSK